MANYNRKPQIYKGKEYRSIKALADEVGVSPSILGSLLNRGFPTETAIARLISINGKTTGKTRNPLYVTSTGDKIWTYAGLASYFGLTLHELDELRIRFGSIDDIIAYIKDKRKQCVDKYMYSNLVSQVAKMIIKSFSSDIDGRIFIFDYEQEGTSRNFTRSVPSSIKTKIGSIVDNVPKFLYDVSVKASKNLCKIIGDGYLGEIAFTMYWSGKDDCTCLFIVNIIKKDKE